MNLTDTLADRFVNLSDEQVQEIGELIDDFLAIRDPEAWETVIELLLPESIGKPMR